MKRIEGLMRDDLSEGTRLRAVIETAVDGVILIDAEGSVLSFNPACERLFGYAAAEVIGRNVKMLMPDPFHGEHDRYLSNYASTGERKIIGIGREVSARRRDGSTFPVNLSVGEAKQPAGSIFVGIIHDLTERKRMEEQLVHAQKMEVVGQLSGGIAHDFNNLLTVMIGNAELLGEKLKARPDLRHFCESIIAAGERGAQLTRRLLAFSRRQDLQPSVIDCNQLIGGLKILIGRTLRDNIELNAACDRKVVLAFADRAQLESAILNLALNAQDAMPDGGALTIAAGNAILDERYRDEHPEVVPGAYAVISVTDNGHGIPPEILQRVFEPFFTTKEVGKGSGLGLSMVYGFAKQSNGHLAIYSEPRLGTTVRLYLPAAKSHAGPEAVETTMDAAMPHGNESILIVEDDAYVRGYAVGSLESLGYRVTTASNGPDALLKLGRPDVSVDLLFSDVVMPGGLSGWELAEQARALRPNLKILLTSGYALEANAGGHPDAKLVVLNKPYRKAELARRLREVFDQPEGAA